MNNKHISKGDQKQVNVIVIGANGQIGQEVVKQLKEKGKFNVKAAIRKEVQKENLNHLDIETVMLNLESSVDELASAIAGNDIVVFTAGSGGSTGYDKTLLIDLDGAIKAIEAAEQSGVKQFIMVSAYGADKRETWADSIKPYYVAKYYADKALLNSSWHIPFFILQLYPTAKGQERYPCMNHRRKFHAKMWHVSSPKWREMKKHIASPLIYLPGRQPSVISKKNYRLYGERTALLNYQRDN